MASVDRQRIGLIAGNGRFPVIFAERARQEGVEVVAVAHRGETPPDIDATGARVTWVRVGELGRIIQVFKEAGITRAVMAGGIRKARLFSEFQPDERGQTLIARMGPIQDDAVLRGVAEELAGEGIRIVDSTIFLSRIIAGEGVLTRERPRWHEWEDIRLGFRVAKEIGRWEIGQTVVVKRGVVLAVEGIEGTDTTIRRGGDLGRGDVVVVKTSKPHQDLRFDVPAVGPETVAVLKEAGGRVLAMEAGKTIIIDREECLRAADEAGLVVVGVAKTSV